MANPFQTINCHEQGIPFLGWFPLPRNGSRLGDCVPPVRLQALKGLITAAGPCYCQRLDFLLVAEAKVQGRLRAGHEAPGRGEIAGQFLIRVCQPNRHGGTNAEPVACRSNKLHNNPMA